jgi:hypothetical protein
MKRWLRRLFGKRMSDHEAAALHRRQFAQHGLLVACSKRCIGPQRLPVQHAIREESKNVADSGWIIASGTESADFAADPRNYALVPLELMIETDASLAILRDEPVGTELTRRHANEPWRWIVDEKVVDRDGKTVGELS